MLTDEVHLTPTPRYLAPVKTTGATRPTASTAGAGRTRRVVSLAVGTVLVASGLTAVSATAANAVLIVCAPGVNTFVWDGNANDTAGKVGDNRNWADAYNWNVDCTPGLVSQPQDDNVTIPSTANVFINDGESAYVNSLTNNGSMTLTPGGVLGTLASSTSKTMLLQGLLFGTGRFAVTGTLTWQSTTMGAASMSTRRCAEPPGVGQVSCVTPAPSPGVTVVNAGAKLVINGRGVNLFDQRIIENHGTTTVSGAGYIAADYGTSFRNLRAAGAVQPKLVFASDGGYYQGFAIPGFGLSTLTNSGLVNKSGGLGVTVIDAAFSTSDPGSTFTGVQQVQSGTLTIVTPGIGIRKAKVRQGATLGNGGPPACDPVANPLSCHVAEPTADDQEVATVQLTKPGTTSSTVTIQEVSGVPTVPGQRGLPVRIETPSAQADVTAPLRFRILLDATLLQPGETAATFAATASVARQATTADPYVNLPDCVNNLPTLAMPSCVARGLTVSETAALGTGDVVIVISSLLNSRYRITKIPSA